MDIVKQLTEWAIPLSMTMDENLGDVQSYLTKQFFPIIGDFPKQLIHRDAHPQNIVFDRGQLTGFIDFDLSTVGIRLFDLCYCSTAILMKDFFNERHKENWFHVLEKLVNGYETNSRLSQIERKAILPMVLSIQFIFTAYFADIDKELSKINLQALQWLYDQGDRIEQITGSSPVS